jgi:F0F1-type ATP synthase delta subunit
MTTGLTLQLIIPLVIIFGVIVFILSRVLGRHTKIAVEKLQKLNEDNLRREIELKRKLDEAEKSYKQRMSEVEQLEMKIKESAQKEALETRDGIINRANTERDEIMTEAREEYKQIKSQAVKEIELSIMDKANDILIASLSKALLEGTFQSHFIEAVIGELTSLKSPLEITEDIILVKTPFPLTAEQRKKLFAVLNDKINAKINITEKIEPSYIAGIYLKIGNLVIDGTLNNKINQAIISLKDSIKNRV